LGTAGSGFRWYAGRRTRLVLLVSVAVPGGGDACPGTTARPASGELVGWNDDRRSMAGGPDGGRNRG